MGFGLKNLGQEKLAPTLKWRIMLKPEAAPYLRNRLKSTLGCLLNASHVSNDSTLSASRLPRQYTVLHFDTVMKQLHVDTALSPQRRVMAFVIYFEEMAGTRMDDSQAR